jgi:hypothetical protein
MNPRILPHQRLPRIGHATAARCATAVVAAAVFFSSSLFASDHADPIDPFNRERLEGGITDLFVFPILDDGKPAFPFERKDATSLAKPDLSLRPALGREKQSKIKSLVVIMCVRRALTETGSLRLEPYTYRIHMDLHSTVSFENTPADMPSGSKPLEGGVGYKPLTKPDSVRPTGAEARARYGGSIANPAGISDDVLIEFTLKNDATIRDIRPKGLKGITDLKSFHVGPEADPGMPNAWASVRDDPFIFPAFFGTNVVAMVLTIPMSAFPDGQQDFLVWGTSSKGTRQIDHVGRSLRTQNPRFELLNTLPPREHKAAILEEHEHPSLLRDIALRFNAQSIFAYRKWDFVPDVMIFTTRFGVGFPNGRVLTDDVAALLAQHGDTLLLELSHHTGGWPRQTMNDKPFLESFPYLAEPWDDKDVPPAEGLEPESWFKLIVIAVAALLVLAVENWLVARWYYQYHDKLRRRNL